MVQIVQVFPDRTTKVLPGEPLKFVVSIKDAPQGLQVEIWTDISCKESPHDGEYAIPLRKVAEENGIARYERTITPDKCGFYSFAARHLSAQGWEWRGGSYERRALTALYVEPSWIPECIIYNAFVRQFGAHDRDGDGIIQPGEGGTFNDLIERMDHFKSLGIGAIYLNPIQLTGDTFHYHEEIVQHFQDETNHLPVHMHPGSVYSVKDYKSIDPELGFNIKDQETDQYHEFRRFVRACHKNGIRIILDVVFGHTAKDSFIQRLHPEWFLYKKDPNSVEEPFVYYEDPETECWGKPDKAASPYDHGLFWTDCSRLNWNYKSPPGPNPSPNPRIREMREYFKSVLRYWIKNYGVDGFRLDVAYSVPPEFWHEALEDCRQLAARACEQKSADAPLTPEIAFIGETYVDEVYDLHACGITLLNGDFSSKISTVEQLKGYLDYAYNLSGDFFPHGSRWMLFPECHDFGRLPEKFRESLRNEDSDVRLNKSRWTLAATLPGTPMLHNGYEVVEHKSISVRSYTGINWESEKNIAGYIAKVNEVRNGHPALQRGRYLFVDSEQGVSADAQLYAFIRDHVENGERDTLLVVVNIDFNASAEFVSIHLPKLEGYDWDAPFILHDLLSGERFDRQGREIKIRLDPGESHIFEVIQ